MLEAYKDFLTRKMLNKIIEIQEFICEESHYYFNFIKEELFGIVESATQTYFIVLNSRKDVAFKIEQKISTDYKRFLKEAIKNNIHSLSWKKLLKNGLYMNPASGRSKLNNYCDIHRLTACLKENITGLEVHHKDDNGLNNNIINLCPQDPIKHRRITSENRRRKRLA